MVIVSASAITMATGRRETVIHAVRDDPPINPSHCVIGSSLRKAWGGGGIMPRVDSYLPLSFCQIIAKEALACRANARGRRPRATLSAPASPHFALN